jgi:hypothetical protein
MKYKRTPFADKINLVDDNGGSTTFAEGTKGWDKYIQWCSEGNTPEEYITAAEQADIDSTKYMALRRVAYAEAGLFHNDYVEMLMEGDTLGQADYIARRDVIRAQFPKPTA